ncbi:outer membrane beta-barrel protein [Psychromonas aquimarina]|uniref:outer membrane beta-barrel protein n=1 Tax=Psychromonas aquimarina TaxID=444919 RepID=UPI0004001719|nr:outer membrane beta-barrel protein [Psychromonas aquimarina]
MNMFNKKSLTLIMMSTFAGAAFASNPAPQTEYFLGGDLGARLSGSIESEYNGIKTEEDMSSSLVFGLHGGVILNQTHKLTLGYDYRGVSQEGEGDDSQEVGTIYSKYDYMVPIADSLKWTVGGKLGYEMLDADYDLSELDGVILGVQTGLDYRFNDWSVGTEAAYIYHTSDMEFEGDSVKIGDEVLLMTNLAYHF